MNSKYITQFKEALKDENLKFTNQRFAVFKFLFSNKGHFECEEIIVRLKKQQVKVSRATAYRTLDLLVKYNFARKMMLDDGITRYENKVDSPHHDHIISIDTGKIIEFESEEIETIQENIAKKHGYKIVKHIHQLFVKKINEK